MPKTTLSEAKELGLKFYWTGTPCHNGHNSKRRVQGGDCCACGYLRNKSNYAASKEKSRLRSAEKKAQMAEFTLGFKTRQKALEVYAKTGSLEQAAKAANLTVSQLQVQIAKSLEFTTSITTLEKRLKAQGLIKDTPVLPDDTDYEWTDEGRAKFIRVYVDTGDIAAARDSIGITSSMYNDEVERNDDFKDRVAEARPKAAQALEERAIQMALRGNDKILTLVLKARLPEYKDKIQIEQTTTIKLDDTQLTNRIQMLLNRYRGEVIDVEFTESEPERERAAISGPGRDRSETPVQ